jgi:group I intron endonuclease
MNNKIHGIYSISNKINGKSYIGSSCDIIRRWRHHEQNLNKGIHHCIYLQRAWNKYGKNNFVFHIEAKCTKDNLISLEQSFLDKAKLNRKQYYNSTYHAGGQEPKNVTKKQKQDIKNYWLNNNTAATFKYAKQKYGFGLLLIQYLLVDIRNEIKERPEQTHLINPTIHTFYHKNGTIFVGRAYDLRQKYNMRHSSICCLISGKYKSTEGWSLSPYNLFKTK